MARFRLELALRATSPIHVSELGDWAFDPSARRWRPLYGQTAPSGMFRGTRTIRRRLQPLVEAPAEAPDDEDVEADEGPETGSGGANGRAFAFPVLPGNTVRGALRRECAKVVFDAVEAKGHRVHPSLYRLLMSGQPHGQLGGGKAEANLRHALPQAQQKLEAHLGSLDKLGADSVQLAVEHAQRSHPALGLFGGGPALTESAVQSGDGIPIQPWSLATEGLLDARAINPGDYACADGPITAPYMLRRRDDMAEGSPLFDETHQAIEGQPEVIDEWRQALAEASQEKGRQQAEGTSEGRAIVGLKNVTLVETVNYGATFFLALDLNCVGDETSQQIQLALLTQGLQRFFDLRRLGAMGRLGFGDLSVLDAALIKADGTTLPSAQWLGVRGDRPDPAAVAGLDEALPEVLAREAEPQHMTRLAYSLADAA